jgi:hypothetical protein
MAGQLNKQNFIAILSMALYSSVYRIFLQVPVINGRVVEQINFSYNHYPAVYGGDKLHYSRALAQIFEAIFFHIYIEFFFKRNFFMMNLLVINIISNFL